VFGSAALSGGPRLIERLAANLVGNAVGRNVPGGHVRVATSVTEGRAVLTVTNTGPVIPGGEVCRLFQPICRLDPVGTSQGRPRLPPQRAGRLPRATAGGGGGERADRLLDLALARLKEAGLVRERTAQRTGSTHVVAARRVPGPGTARGRPGRIAQAMVLPCTWGR
jgi:hypothetical protein